jgi:hypothetical protein
MSMRQHKPTQPEPATSPFAWRKRRALLALAIALALIFVLSIGITGLSLAPGEVFAMPALIQSSAGGGLSGGDTLLVILRVLLAIAFVAFPITLAWSILTKEGRRRLLANLVLIALLWLGLSFVQQAAQEAATGAAPANAGTTAPPTQELLPVMPFPEFTANPPDWTVIAVTLAIALLLVGLVAGGAWLIWQRRQRRPLQRLGEQAQAAIEALQTGGDLRSIVIRCYHDMSEVLQQERNIQRSAAMTPSEFEGALHGKGVPHEAVHQLTRLFEDVRYGAKPTGAREERLAIDSLSAIVAACKSAS